MRRPLGRCSRSAEAAWLGGDANAPFSRHISAMQEVDRARTPRTNRAARPVRLAHVGFGTRRFEALKEWWIVALGARVVHENGDMALLGCDDDPTRVAIVRDHGAARAEDSPPHHVAFEFGCLGDLLGRYGALRGAGSLP